MADLTRLRRQLAFLVVTGPLEGPDWDELNERYRRTHMAIMRHFTHGPHNDPTPPPEAAADQQLGPTA